MYNKFEPIYDHTTLINSLIPQRNALCDLNFFSCEVILKSQFYYGANGL